MTLGGAAAAQLRFIVWCNDCQHQVEPDPGEMAQRFWLQARRWSKFRNCAIRNISNYGPILARISRMTEADLFRRCRKALGLSQSAMARALLIVSDRTIRRWEDAEQNVSGPAWIALSHILSQHPSLTDRIATVIEARRAADLPLEHQK
jgi:DNA-binding transcriptional regulator YiaG